MSKFYASIQGQRGPATRTGAKAIRGHIRGWEIGVHVEGVLRGNGEIAFYVYATGGSNRPAHQLPIAIVEHGQAISCLPKGHADIG